VTSRLCWGLLRAVLAVAMLSLGGCAEGGSTRGDGGRVVTPDAPVVRDGPPVVPDTGMIRVDTGPPPPCSSDGDCDDGMYCNGVETCGPDGCVGGDPPVCDDGKTCTTDSCDEVSDTCAFTLSPSACNDGLACNGAEACDPSAPGADPTSGCARGAPVSCDDGMACTTDMCVEPDGTCMSLGSDADRDSYIAIGCAGGNDCDDTAAAIHPGAPEVCDGMDNDCSGRADDGAGMECVLGSAPASCTTMCSTSGTQPCNTACRRGPCTAATETCNDCDDDGDGAIDDGLTCRRGASRSCMTGCSTSGSQTCNSMCSGYGTCVAAAETCGNMCDDNGNGMIDEGCTPLGPPNDLCGGAEALTGSGTIAGTLVGATAQTTDCGSGVEVFYRVTITQPSFVYLDTFAGTAFDSRISYRGTACPGTGTGTACNDDACGTVQSQILRQLAAGTYYFAVHTFTSATVPGPFILSYQIVPQANGTNTALAATGTFTGTTSGTGRIAMACGFGTSPETEYHWTQCPAQTRTVSANTCTGTAWDTVLHIVGPGGSIACNDDFCGSTGLQSRLTSVGTSGAGFYQLVVDGYDGDMGSYSLGVTAF